MSGMGNVTIDMIQNFDVVGGPKMGRDNVPLLRAELTRLGLDGLLIPHEDEYNNEYLPDYNERLMWATGFTGSAGAAIVLIDRAAMFTDGRYTLQVRQQVDSDLFAYARLEDGIAAWLRTHLRKGETIGYDPRLHPPKAVSALHKAAQAAGATLVALEINPIDTAWTDRPAAPKGAVSIQTEALAGKSHTQKRTEIGKSIAQAGADAAMLTAPASIAWLLNLRGSDVRCTPLMLANAIIDIDGHVSLYVDPDKLSDEVRTHLGHEVSITSEDRLAADLSHWSGKTLIVDPTTSSAWHSQSLKDAGATVLAQEDPVALPKAIKSDAELRGSETAHRRDAVPLIRFLHWLDTEAQSGDYDEIDAAVKLETFRHDTGVLKDLSFETISGAGSNGAHCHYRVNTATTLPLAPGTLYLVDSGGQYVDGTTDVTRTIPIGTPSQEMCERYTLVLQGHIALATIRFPAGTTGSNLDAIARYPLWQAGLDYDHGTGHGVGAFLGVHEGPQRISKSPNSVALETGMIVSNEPGYYKTGEYGIRIENLQYVTKPEDVSGGERPMHGFHTLTLAPFCRALIDTDMLTRAERDYVNAYHARVLTEMAPALDEPTSAWLNQACRPL